MTDTKDIKSHRRHHHRRRHRQGLFVKRAIWSMLCGLLVYALLLVVADQAGRHLGEEDQPAAPQVYGDLSDRFGPSMTLELADRTYAYRDGEIVNILLIGEDTRTLSGADNRAQSDFLLLLSVDKTRRSITPLLVNRDTMAEIAFYGPFGDPLGDGVTQICLAQAYSGGEVSGSENSRDAVSRLLMDLPIDYYLAMDMDGIARVNDELGGVTLTLEDDFSHIDPQMRKGETLTLTGAQAETFVRGRLNVSDGSNRSRMRRQTQYLDALMTQLAQAMAGDANAAGRLYDALSGDMETDMSRGYLVNEAYGFSGYEVAPIAQLAGEYQIGSKGYVEFYPDADALLAMIVKLCFE